MKVLSLSLVLAAGLLAQTPAPSDRPAPGSTASSPGNTQAMTPPTLMGTPPTPVTPDTVVAKVGDKSYTAAEMDKLLSDLPPQLQMAVARQPQLLTNMFMVKTLAQQAEFENLDKEPMIRQTLDYQRMNTLAQAEVNHYRNQVKITADSEKAYYEQNKDQYRVAKVQAIKIAFTPAPAVAPGVKVPVSEPKPAAGGRTEAEAKAKIEDMRKQLLGGADFGMLAAAASDDKTSAAKGGDYGEITMSSPSEKEKVAVFKLKPGEISEPVQEPGAFYIFKVQEMTVEPFEKVQGKVLQQMQQGEFTAWIKGIEARNKVTIENPGWFATRNAR